MDKIEKRLSLRSVLRFLENNAITVLMILAAIVVGILRPNFFSRANFTNLSVNTAVRFIIALGVSGCLITKGTDLSAGRVVGLAACVAASLLQNQTYGDRFFPNLPNLNVFAVLGIVLLVCAIIGAANGAVISFFKVPPFIATLGMQTLVYGLCLVYTGAQPIGSLKPAYTNIANGNLFGIPFLFLIAFVCAVFMWILYNKTRHGKYMYAIGGNEHAAEVSGINTSKMKIRIYALAAIAYGLAGYLLAAKSGGASVNMGMGYELEAIAACTIGGVSTNGGVGRVSGILVGVLVFELLKILLQFVGVESSYTYVVQGIVIIVAVALDLRKYSVKK